MVIKFAEFRDVVRELGLDRYWDAIAEVARPALRLELTDVPDRSIPIGASKIGGDPDLAHGAPWPVVRDGENDRALQFIAQFDLAELAATSTYTKLPTSGLLSFFYEIYEQRWGGAGDRGWWRTIFTSADTRLERRGSPPPPEGERYPVLYQLEVFQHPDVVERKDAFAQHILSRRIAFEEYVSFRDHGEYNNSKNRADWPWNPDDAEIQFDDVDKPKLAELLDLPFAFGHQLLGHPFTIQNSMEAGCEKAWRESKRLAGEPAPPDEPEGVWQLLLQIDSLQEMMWGDSGIIYFWIRSSDLREGRFNDGWFELQCC